MPGTSFSGVLIGISPIGHLTSIQGIIQKRNGPGMLLLECWGYSVISPKGQEQLLELF